ncbi:MAG: FtsX-like permease family protein [Bacteroidales bacterium]
MKNSSYLTSFYNSLKSYKFYTGINIIGFSISLAFVIFILLYARKELLVDSFHINKEQIYRVESQKNTLFDYPLADNIKIRYPEIQDVVRVLRREIILSDKDGVDFSGNAMITDSCFFSTFSFPFVEGNAGTALQSQSAVVLSETFARKLFPSESALGKVFKLYGKQYNISGVVKEFENTHFSRVDVFLPYSFLIAEWGERVTSKGNSIWNLYILTKANADISSKAHDLEQFIHSEEEFKSKGAIVKSINFMPLHQVYFNPSKDDPTYQKGNSVSFLTVLLIVALSILTFAVINYINLTVAQIGNRAHEIAVRRLLGDSKLRVFIKTILESIVLCAISVVLSLFGVLGIQNWLQNILGTDVSLLWGMNWLNVLILIGGTILLGCISGIIPASIIAGFKPIHIVSGALRRKTQTTYSKIFITVQYAVTIVLIGCTITIFEQMRLMKQGYLGFNKENLLICSNLLYANEQAAFRDKLLTVSGVQKVSFVRGYPMSEDLGTLKIQTKEGEQVEYDFYIGDSTFLSILNLDIIHRTGTENKNAYWLNETAWRELGLTDDATEYRAADGKVIPIQGKVKDFHSRDFTRKIDGCVIRPLGEREAWEILIKISGSNVRETIGKIKQIYNTQAEGDLFDGVFMDQKIATLYAKQTKISQMISILSILAIILSSLGMLAIATYYSRQRAKEIAVRKTYGAANVEVLCLLISNFLKPVFMALIVAVPVIWYIMSHWLAIYAYRIHLSWVIFATAGVLTIFIAVTTVYWQSIRAANRPPILSLLKNNL